MEHIGLRIKKKRLEKGLSQEELARTLGYRSKSTINKIEKGINDITQSNIVRFAEALDTTPAYLMGWESEANKDVDSIGQRIRKRRIELNMSQQELAERTGYSGKTTIAKIESGVNKLRQPKILAFAEALCMTPSELLGLADVSQLKAYNYEHDMEVIPELKELNEIIKSNIRNNDFMSKILEYARMLSEYYKGGKKM